MKFKTHKCGGKILGQNNYIIRNMNSSDSNEKIVDCAWFVKYQEGYSVEVTFKKMNFTSPCKNEYVSIYNGPSMEAPLKKIFCGSQFEDGIKSVKSDGNSMFIVYHADDFIGNGKNSQFEIEVKSGSVGCGGSLSAFSKEFTTPFYGTSQYPENTECIWDISVDNNYHIGLTFKDRFFIEDSPNCTKDSLEIFDFKDGEWASLGKICGRESPLPFNSTSSKMRVIFRSDEKSNGDGFKAVWQQNCGGIYRVDENKKLLSSPGYPHIYKKNLFCNYTFVAPEGKFINLNFLDFQVEVSETMCGYDNVTLYKKQKYLYPKQIEKIGTFCGNDQPGRFRNEEMMSMTFSSDGYIEKKGWMVEYSLDSCGGAINTNAIIQSPEVIKNDDDIYSYQGSIYCNWNITVPDDKKVIIKFQKFVLELSDLCSFDYVEVYNSTTMVDKNRLAKICGNLTGIIKPIVINEKNVMIRLKTDQTQKYEGFTAEIIMQKKCDMKIDLSIERPSYTVDNSTGNYSEANECTFLFTSDALSVLKITIEKLHLSTCDPDVNNVTCDCDYLDILDGNSPYSPEITRICGYDLPDGDIITTRNAVFIRFVTDSVKPSTGFKFTVQRIPSPCGSLPEMTIPDNETRSFNIYSPSIPDGSKYLPNINCLWVIHLPYGKYYDVKFTRFDLEDSENCEKDSLTIEDATVQDYVTEGFGQELIYRGKSFLALSPSFYTGTSGPVAPHVYCGSQPPHDFYSQSANIKIRFKSDANVERTGFNLTISSLESCSRNFTALQGRLVSNNPNNCKSTIIVPSNFTISLFFVKFYMAESDCTKSFLNIYDGTFEDGKLIRTQCGYLIPNPVFSTTNQLSLIFHFKEDSLSYSRGNFDLVYYASDKREGCGGEMFNYGGVFSSPMYPITNRTFYDCLWTVTTPRNLKLALKFKSELKLN
jgi:cubilin